MPDNMRVEPTRIVSARRCRGKLQAHLAKDVRCSPSYYAEIESGRKLADKYIDYIAEELNFPLEYFYLDAVLPAEALSYRRKARMRTNARQITEGYAETVASTMPRVMENYVHLPEVALKDMSFLAGGSDPLGDAERAASAVRADFGLGNASLKNALHLVEALGVLVFWVDGDADFDAVSFWFGSQPIILMNRNVTDGYRARFTILHELFHLLAHRMVEELSKSEEAQANRFASAMLMPSGLFAKTFHAYSSVYSILDDRMIWGASARAQVRRAYDLGRINEWTYKDLCIKMNRNWGANTEPNPASREISAVHQFFLMEVGDKGKYAMDVAEEARLPYDLFLQAFPEAADFEKNDPSASV